ncbi:MAG TPA: GNAT family N-acetyltransferase [Verrucomicrobiae bacterium]
MNRILSPTEALLGLRSGMRVFIGSGCAAPQSLIEAMIARGGDLFDVEIVHLLTFGSAPYAAKEWLENFRHNAFFIGQNVRSAVNDGCSDYTPIHLSDVPLLIRRRRMHLDIALVQVTPPDAHGYCSLGVSVDIVKAAVENADHVIAEINPNMPRTLGDSFVHKSRISTFVQSDLPILEFPPVGSSPEAKLIGEFIAGLVEDGSTLQTGIGEIPSAVLAALQDKHDLGIHTEMFTEALIPLIERGVVSGTKKTLLPGKIVTSFCFGTRKLYDYIHDNPAFEFRPTEFTNDPFQIARNEKMVAVSSALQVDLTGQVCADSIGSRFYSGFGGQLDFMRGAARSNGGKPIIALLSTAKGGSISRIVPYLDEGAGVVTTRADVHYVVTEYGVAYLHGKTVRERALALINIAHPKFRDELLRSARERKLVHPQQIACAAGAYPRKYEKTYTFPDGLKLFIRPVQPSDEGLLKELFYSHSPETVFHRYFTPLKHLSQEQVQKFVTLDYENDMALVALTSIEGCEKMIAVGRYFRDRATNEAEVALTLHDDYQKRGIGTFLMRYLAKVAADHGISILRADVLPDNAGMMRVFQKVWRKVEVDSCEGVLKVKLTVPKPSGQTNDETDGSSSARPVKNARAAGKGIAPAVPKR